ncbi:hypothetical protein H7H48_15955 [Nitratireductor sp. B36]|uniref:hypothetical protein n=1 Tax=Nitratireductor sp. B36 TaxID=2762059 RepID=UPI001E2C1148|nr:hypothetical protein [Nitratireductor sp. B36]MCC5780556.1 hypothetical protein [Nitratireductor sp. B36]
MKRVPVYDYHNDKRLLGSLPTAMLPTPREGSNRGSIKVGFMPSWPPRLYAGPYDLPGPDEVEMSVLHFDVRTRINAGWDPEAYLATDACLSSLMKLDGFRLPHEAKAVARHRMEAARYLS